MKCQRTRLKGRDEVGGIGLRGELPRPRPPVMRRPQFTMKTLLCFMTAVAVLLGAPSLIKRYGQFVEARPCNAGDPVMIRGRLIRFFGPKRIRCILNIDDPNGELGIMVERDCSRSWLCVYSIEIEFDRGGHDPFASGPSTGVSLWNHVAPEPGEYDVKLFRFYEPGETAVTTKLVVLPR